MNKLYLKEDFYIKNLCFYLKKESKALYYNNFIGISKYIYIRIIWTIIKS